MSAKLAIKPSRALLTQLESMLDEVQTPECRHWLEQELEGYLSPHPCLGIASFPVGNAVTFWI